MTALLEDQLLEAAPLKTGNTPAPPADELAGRLYGDASNPFTPSRAMAHSTTGDAIKSAMPDLVKGAGLAVKGGNTPLEDPNKIAVLASQAALGLRSEVYRGYHNKADVVKSGFSGDFLSQFGALRTALMTPSIGEQLGQIVQAIGNPDLTRSFTAGNLGIGSVYGFVPSSGGLGE